MGDAKLKLTEDTMKYIWMLWLFSGSVLAQGSLRERDSSWRRKQKSDNNFIIKLMEK
jgi:hypothetical protein